MRLDVMQYFLAVADEKSISKVSRKYDIPKQSLSSMLNTMNDELGTSMFAVSGSGMELTEAGQRMYRFCSEFVKDYGTLQEVLHPRENLNKKEITVITQNSIAQTILPKWMSSLMRHKPEIVLNLEIGNASTIIEMIVQEQAQIGFILLFEKGDNTYPKLSEDLVFYPITTSRPYYWISERNPLFQQQSLAMQSLNDYTVVKDKNTDEEMFDYIYRETFKMESQYFHASNVHIILQLLRENMVICPDIKVENGELGLAYVFDKYSDIKALPLNTKDNYKLVTGYIVKSKITQEYDLESILKYI